ncbi:MAG: hypothetical protein H0X62_13425 [Bacteroidetes bacterium]|nr:hypothetical protein [Bacteroidota bacterium]
MRDILLDENNELLIKNGDLVMGDATKQHQKHLLMASKGEYKQSPTTGVGLMSFLDDENPDDLLREIRKEFARDGMTVNDIKIKGDGSISIDAAYEK